MQTKPEIAVQIVHIQGPLKGEIQEFTDPEIWIGRHPSCQICFPKDLAIISRQHAKIEREGNRFKLIDQNANGTFVNGKAVEEIYLKNGDVLIFAEGGPKVSFLTKMMETPRASRPSRQSREIPEPAAQFQPPPAPEPPPPRPAATPSTSTAKAQAPLIIQFGPTLQSFKELPVVIGQDPACDFVLPHPSIESRHVRISFQQDQYWIEDLTGKSRIVIDGRPVVQPTPLQAESRLSLSSRGPHFRFFGAGRLAEIEETVEEPERAEPQAEPASREKKAPQPAKKPSGLFKKIFK